MSQDLPSLSSELLYATLTAAFTGLIWVPIVINRLSEMGPWMALKNPQPDVRPHADWAYRASHAHRNAIENLAVFAPLAIIVHLLGLSTPLTAAAALVFFGSLGTCMVDKSLNPKQTVHIPRDQG
ncbi:MAG: MAPEG family protein [Methylococcaceae bacterium]|nr:MAPEG family protein [Methylococcaceae bacterium]